MSTISFEPESYRVISEKRTGHEATTEATVKLVVGGRRVIATDEGDGPEEALENALRRAVEELCPWVEGVRLSDPARRGTLGEETSTGTLKDRWVTLLENARSALQRGDSGPKVVAR